MDIKQVAVLGSGVMGSQIAAHLANAGISSYMFDLDSEIVKKGFDFAKAVKPNAFFTEKDSKKIKLCNYNNDLEKLKECDWVIEVIGEKIEWKYELYSKIIPYLNNKAILSSNTSSLTTQELNKHFPDNVKQRFFITHFFNPPRYLRLLELIKSEETDETIFRDFAKFAEDVLGKTIVYGKNTAGFVANRIGVFGIMLTMELQQKYAIPIHMIDKLTGTLIARPKSATFRTADVVGLDTMINVSQSLFDRCQDDPHRQIFKIPEFLKSMQEKKLLGQKTKSGFFKKDKDTNEIFNINFKTLEYEPAQKLKYDTYKIAKDYVDMNKRLAAIVRSDDVAGKFMAELIIRSCMYAAERIPEIADDVIQIDNAIKAGFGWDLGPFEVLDAIGVAFASKYYAFLGFKIPEIVEKLLKTGNEKFYQIKDGNLEYFDLLSSTYKAKPDDKSYLTLDLVKKSNGVIERNWCSSFIDIGDGVACLQFHSILQSTLHIVDGSIMDMLQRAPRLVEKYGFKGLVLGHQGANFSAGANLQMVLALIKMKMFGFVEQITENFQMFNQGLRFAPFPVVSAPFNLTLGGGFEMISAADKVIASAETYMGLVEVGVGLIPAGGGCLRLIMNWQDQINSSQAGWGKENMGPFPVAQKAFETIAFAKVSTSGKEAFELGYLRPQDRLCMNPLQLIAKAKEEVINLSVNYQTPKERDDLHLTGESGRLVFEQSIDEYVLKNTISEYDAHVGKKVALILTGGNKTNGIKRLTETAILELEREAFMSLCGEKKTQERMDYMLKNGKPLRN